MIADLFSSRRMQDDIYPFCLNGTQKDYVERLLNRIKSSGQYRININPNFLFDLKDFECGHFGRD